MNNKDYYKDFLGKQLNIGDNVIFSETKIYLKQGVISRMTPKKVYIIPNKESYGVHRYPSDVIKI